MKIVFFNLLVGVVLVSIGVSILSDTPSWFGVLNLSLGAWNLFFVSLRFRD